MVDADGSEDVQDFLQRIRELGDKRNREDEERTKKLEEEILQGRLERQARRAERARSISPTKDSPSNTPQSLRSRPDTPTSQMSSNRRLNFRPSPVHTSREVVVSDTLAQLTGDMSPGTSLPSKIEDRKLAASPSARVSSPSPSSAMPPSRVNTLSWQQRPKSSAYSGPRNQPPTIEPTDVEASEPQDLAKHRMEPTSSKEAIAEALALKDPMWFKQTADRGEGSPALRRGPDNLESNMLPDVSRRHLPGMPYSLRSGTEPQSQTGTGASGRTTPSAESSVSTERLRSEFSSPKKSSNSESEDVRSGRPPMMSPSQSRISWEPTERSTSPTKGLGGFVQSAMLKRSDSVNKRWSNQPSFGPSRGNSIMSNLSGYGSSSDGLAGLSSAGRTVTLQSGRETSPPASSRPTSIHSNNIDDPSFSQLNSLASSNTSGVGQTDSPSEIQPSAVPTSPSKTMDPRRWSPTKASWLESALNKPDSPKLKSPPLDAPNWRVSMQNARQHKGTTRPDIGSTPFGEVKTTGLMRAPPPGRFDKPATITGPPKEFTSGPIKKENSEGAIAELGTESPQKRSSPPVKPKRNELITIFPTSKGTDTLSSTQSSDKQAERTTTAEPKAPLDDGMTKVLNNDVSQLNSATKIKPATPPKKDLRSSLRARQQGADPLKEEEPEFKNVFGKLRRTQTQNYIAPDELKENILRGKAGLSVTGGPKKSERKDELKESILQQKEAMRAKPSEQTRSAKSSGNDLDLPEAIVKRKNMMRSSPPNGQSERKSPLTDSVSMHEEPRITLKAGKMSQVSTSPAVADSSESISSTLSGKLTARFNPALAGLLARGPSPLTHGTNEKARPILDQGSNTSAPQSSDRNLSDTSDTHLTHMTKGRARGPKRRPPTSGVEPSAPSASNAQHAPANGSNRFLPSSTEISAAKSVDKKHESRTNSPGRLLLDHEIRANLDLSTKDSQQAQLSEVTENTFREESKVPEHVDEEKPTSRDRSSRSVKDTSNMWNQISGGKTSSASFQKRAERPPLAIRKHNAEGGDFVEVQSRTTKPIGLGISGDISQTDRQPPDSQELLQSPESVCSKAISPPAVGKKPASLGARTFSTISATGSSPKESPIPHTSEALKLLTDFFDEAPVSKARLDMDTSTILASTSDGPEKTKTLRKFIWEIWSDGKKENIPQDREHILFEDSMYLCSHIFGTPEGKRCSEVYLWCGDGVPQAAIEDAQVFSRKAAKDNDAHLISFRQGKESTKFFQALGGIVITRRGSSVRERSSAAYMLCGRKHLGQIAFDEVDMSPSSLCSGFPYIVSSRQGKVFIWKGKGSGAEELGSARLIGMDLGLAGEIEEVEEGRETPEFLSCFSSLSSTVIPQSAQHWRLKASYDQYRCRLFLVEQSSSPKGNSQRILGMLMPQSPSPGTQVQEISPFSQKDLQPGRIYVLDAFFELYIIVGSESQSRFPEFDLALQFAQEYGILAASVEDRPFVPVSTVVLEGVPRDLKAVFRKWDEIHWTTTSKSQNKPSLKMVPLSAAIEATRNKYV